VILGFSEEEFWRMTPRKLTALGQKHLEVEKAKNGDGSGKKSEQKVAYIDQVLPI